MRTFCFIFCSKKNIKLWFRFQQKVVFIPILNIQICFLGVKTCFFINFFSFFKTECVSWEFLALLYENKRVMVKFRGLHQKTCSNRSRLSLPTLLSYLDVCTQKYWSFFKTAWKNIVHFIKWSKKIPKRLREQKVCVT